MLQVSVGVVCRYIWAVAVFQDYIGHPFDILLARHTNQILTILYASEDAIKFVFGPLFGPR
jgi:hypothetical protein